MSVSLQHDEAAAPFDPRARLGECIAEKWTLDAVLGTGGMAVVYGATHRNGHRTAIKMLLPEIARDESLVTRFLREGYLANKVPHDGAVRVLDDGRADDGSPFLVMERLDGYTLDAHLKRGEPAMDMRATVGVMLALLEILEAAHAVGIVHRDIKPANIFLTKQGELKLLDFGIAVLVESSPRTGGTQTGVIIGTPAFMAPEQARGRKELVGPRSDLWAVGASGLALMVGGRLRDATTLSEELAMAALQPLPPASSFGEGLRGRLGDVIDRAVAFEPRDRFATAAEMRAALASCASEVLPVALGARGIPRTARMGPSPVPVPGARDTVEVGSSAVHPIGTVDRPLALSPRPSSAALLSPALTLASPITGSASGAAEPARRPWLALVALAFASVAVVAVLSVVVLKKLRAASLSPLPATSASSASQASSASGSSVASTALPPMLAPPPSLSSSTVVAAASAAPSGRPAPSTFRPFTGRPGPGPGPGRPSTATSAKPKPDFMDEQ